MPPATFKDPPGPSTSLHLQGAGGGGRPGAMNATSTALLCADVTFGIQKGATLVVSGPNGCGKSTLLRVLCDLQDVGSGVPQLPSD